MGISFLHYHKINFSFQQVNLCDLDFDYISKAVNFATPVSDQGKLFLVEFVEIIRECPDMHKAVQLELIYLYKESVFLNTGNNALHHPVGMFFEMSEQLEFYDFAFSVLCPFFGS